MVVRKAVLRRSCWLAWRTLLRRLRSLPNGRTSYLSKLKGSLRVKSLFLSIPCPDSTLEPIPDPSKFQPREGESARQATRRRNAELDAEISAINCIALYMLIMNFSQNGI